MNPQQILLKYWKHSAFRPLQEEIINSVMQGNDTLALLPTGGGKSVCFQVPALAMDGLCLVVSPLIALMKDQVESLRIKGIRAVAIYSGMHYSQIDLALDNCVHGDTKFLYLSPERLMNDTVRARLRRMKVNLIAVDEAHCVSQWGYDFRPPYLNIADIRELLPHTPLLALTATATPDVINDIQDKLKFGARNVFRLSFERKNLTYAVVKEDDKQGRLLRMMGRVSGSGLIYVRNRRKTKLIAEFLNKSGIACTFYHAGLDSATRDEHQKQWMAGEMRMMAATNAFGMGIDKAHVRMVIHYDLPDTVEAYFQEAGRAGRDEKKAFAVLLYNEEDVMDARGNLEHSYPPVEEIRNVYKCLGNYFNLALGSGRDVSFDFDISAFATTYNLRTLTVFNSLKFLEKEGYLLTSDGFYQPSAIHIKADKESLYRFQVENKAYDNFIKTILRSYGGVLNDFVKISETDIAFRTAGLTKDKVKKELMNLDKLGILSYVPAKERPQVIFCMERLDEKNIFISPENYHKRKKIAGAKLEAVIQYCTSRLKCRSQILLRYFGEEDPKRCGHCDVCLERNKLDLSEMEFDQIVDLLKPMLTKESKPLYEAVGMLKNISEDKVISTIRWLMDNDKIGEDENKELYWKK